jgi:hypothetical protein
MYFTDGNVFHLQAVKYNVRKYIKLRTRTQILNCTLETRTQILLLALNTSRMLSTVRKYRISADVRYKALRRLLRISKRHVVVLDAVTPNTNLTSGIRGSVEKQKCCLIIMRQCLVIIIIIKTVSYH